MLETAWLLLFIILFGIILWVYNSTLKKIKCDIKTRLKRLGLVSGVALLWLTYVNVVTNSGILLDTSLPPKIPLLLILPLFLFTGIFLFIKRDNLILHSIPRYVPIAYQSFRAVIEVLFYFTFLKGLFPEVGTFAGYNYDILLGLSAPIAAYFAYKKAGSERLLIAWNFLGLIIVAIAAFIIITSFYAPSIWGSTEPLLPTGFLRFPFVLLPAFFMPSAVFMHILSLIQLIKKLDLKKNVR